MALADAIRMIREQREEARWLVPQLLSDMPTHRVLEPFTAESWIGVSAVPSLCPRAMTMASRLQIKMSDDVDVKGRWRIDRGTAMHMVVQELWLGPLGRLLGGWQCPKCAYIAGSDPTVETDEPVPVVSFRSAVPMPAKCERCGLPNGKWTRFRFVEPRFANRALRVRGHSDGLLHMAPNPMEVLDIKIAGSLDSKYKKDGKLMPSLREAPRHENVLQLQWYMDEANLSSGRLLYVCPSEEKIEKAMVEHPVRFDAAMLHREKEKVRVLREAIEDESRPIPACPYGGQGPYGGECTCVEVAVLWAHHGR